MDNTDLQRHIEQNGIEAEILPMKGRVHSVDAASKELGVPHERFIKTVVFVTESDTPILAIVLGTDRASSKRIGAALSIAPPRLASPEDALRLTKYAVGGTPPISISGAPVIIDPKVIEMEEIIGGGGTDRHLLRIKPQDIARDTNAIVTRIRK